MDLKRSMSVMMQESGLLSATAFAQARSACSKNDRRLRHPVKGSWVASRCSSAFWDFACSWLFFSLSIMSTSTELACCSAVSSLKVAMAPRMFLFSSMIGELLMENARFSSLSVVSVSSASV